MKLKYFFPLLVLIADASAQEAGQSPDGRDAQTGPPKAQVIEEEEDVSQRGAEPRTQEQTESKEAAVEVVEEDAMNVGDDAAADAPAVDPVVPAALDDSDQGAEDVSVDQEPANEGIQIQVEKFNSHAGSRGGAGEVKVSSPWPAKPLDTPPLGWMFVPAPEGVAPYRTTVQLGGDRSVNLSITPHILVPASDGRNVIRIAEPGYRPENIHMQNDTVGTILQQSTEDLERSEVKTSEAINRLQQLLSSLPQP